jgi:hypothetical protein
MSEVPESTQEGPPELPGRAEWKAWYRRKVFGWLMAKKGYLFESIDKSLSDLDDPDRQQAAATALFWNVYLADGEPRNLDAEQVRQIGDFVRRREGKAAKEQEQLLAFVKLHLAGTLAVSLIRPDVRLAETPMAVRALEQAVEAFNRVDMGKVDTSGDYWGPRQLDSDAFVLSCVLVGSIAALELGLWQEEQGKCAEAFVMVHTATTLLRLCDFWSYEKDSRLSRPRAFEYLPHSWDELDFRDAVRIFNALRGDPDQVKYNEWDNIRKACKYFGYLYEYEWDTDLVTDSNGDKSQPLVYWTRAAAFAENEMSNRALLRALREDEAERGKERLRHDFLYDVWGDLAPEVRHHLINAETRWSAKGTSKYKEMMDEYRLALEELLADLFPHLAEKARRPMQRKEGTKQPSLRLTKMQERLQSDLEIRKSITDASTRPSDSDFVLKDLPDFLGRVARLRNAFGHENDREVPMGPDEKNRLIEDANQVRRELLGIRHPEPILYRLVQTKRAMKRGV